MSRQAVLKRILGKNSPVVAKEARATRKVNIASFSAQLQSDMVDELVVQDLNIILYSLQKDRRQRIKGKGSGIFLNDPVKDVAKIDELIKALKLVISFYSLPW